MMLNFDTELDQRGVNRIVTESESATVTAERKSFRLTAEKSHKGKHERTWGWREVRDYVIEQIERRTGPIPRVEFKEASIFQRFVRDWGELAGPIARFAFEVENGVWAGKPVDIYRFTKNSDPIFAEPISERLAPSGLVKDW